MELFMSTKGSVPPDGPSCTMHPACKANGFIRKKLALQARWPYVRVSSEFKTISGFGPALNWPDMQDGLTCRYCILTAKILTAFYG